MSGTPPGPTSSPTQTTEEPGSTTAQSTGDAPPLSTTSVGSTQSTTMEPPPTSGTDGTTTEDEPVDCTAIAAGPFPPVPAFPAALFAGSEDIAFDGLGGLAGRQGDDILRLDAAGTELDRYSDPGGSWGLRYLASGDLLVAHHSVGSIRRIRPNGAVSDFSLGLALVNGLYPDFDGNVWVTNFSSVGRYDSNGVYTELVTGDDAASANGIVLDEERRLLFFTNYEQGLIRRVEVGVDGSLGLIGELVAIPGAFLDGLALDACGHLYAVDNANGVVYRALLDAAGNSPAAAINITNGVMSGVANAQFGRGPGFDARSLYVAGEAGTVYQMDVGIPGAEIPLPG